MKLIKLVALMLVMLFLVIPFSFAVSLTGYGYGADNVVGYAKQQDVVTLRTQVSGIDAEDGEMSYLPLVGSPQTFVCSENVCLLTLEQSTFSSRPYEYLTRFDYSGGRQEQRVTIYPDVLGAKVVCAYVDKTLVSPDDSVTFTINAHDDACSVSGCLGTCTGIRQINVYQGSIANKVHEIPVLQTDCDESITETIAVSALNLQEGVNNIIFEAIDNFENVPRDKKTVLISLDSIAPVIGGEDFSLVKEGSTIEFYNSPISGVELVFAITEDFQSVRVDLSDFGLGTVTPVCNQLYCSYDLDLNLGSVVDGSKSLVVRVELTDTLGNSGVQTLRNSIMVDRSGPVVNSVSVSDVVIDGLPAFGPGTRISVEFDDVAGVQDAFMDFSSINSQQNSVQGECVENVCTFPSIALVNDGIKTLRLSTTTRDILGNVLATPYVFNVYADRTLPSLVDIPFIGFEETEIENYPSRGDTLKIIAVLQGEKEVFAFGNFSKISDEGLIEADCEGGEGVSGWSPSSRGYFEQYSRGYSGDSSGSTSSDSTTSAAPEVEQLPGQIICEWEVEVTGSGSAIDETVMLYFIDPLENVIVEEISIPNVYGVEAEENPNYWTSSVTCSPNALDRVVGELVEQQMFCSISLTPLSSQPQRILSMELDGCEADDFLDDSEIGNTLTEHPYLKLTFDKDEYTINNLDVNCSLEVATVVGNNIVSNTELEYVDIPVTFFNSPFDLPDEALESEIQGIIDEWVEGGLGKMLRWLNILEKLASTICKTVNTWNNAAKIFSVAAAPPPDPVGTPGRVAAEGGAKAAWVSKKTMTKFCDFVNCRMSNDNSKTKQSGVSRLGGNVPWRENIQSVSNFGAGWTEQKLGTSLNEAYFDVKNNVYLSAITLCVPGIIHNLEKYRQIQCFYGYCLQDLTATGIPAASCEKQKAYMECKYFVSPAFKIFSLVNIFDNFMNMVKNIISDPFAAFGFIANLVCPPTQGTWTACRMVRVVTVSLDTWQNVQEIWGEFKGFNEDYCEDLENSPRRSGSSSGRGYV